MKPLHSRTVRRRRLSRRAEAFSLIEVVMAIGILTFAMLPLVALLPVGLKSVKNSVEEAAAANIIGSMANALRHATTTDGTNYTAHFAGRDIAYRLNESGAGVSYTWPELDIEGRESDGRGRVSAHLEILRLPAENPVQPGRAIITVAWPAVADPQWDGNSRTWTRAEGSLTSSIQFTPRP
jgi:type II secretory pathway pseudopilin PulG